MRGVVLCGGQSSRMGTDKGLLLHQSITWVQQAISTLTQLNTPVLLSINEQQLIAYNNGLFIIKI
jgi:molybdopterin-guanine dinucleotide biosynthesis protein A